MLTGHYIKGSSGGGIVGFECPVFGSKCGTLAAVGFSAIRPCGHVVSDKAIKEATVAATGVVPGKQPQHETVPVMCPVCEVPFDPTHVMPAGPCTPLICP